MTAATWPKVLRVEDRPDLGATISQLQLQNGSIQVEVEMRGATASLAGAESVRLTRELAAAVGRMAAAARTSLKAPATKSPPPLGPRVRPHAKARR